MGMAILSKNHELPEMYKYPDTPTRQAVPVDISALMEGIVHSICTACTVTRAAKCTVVHELRAPVYSNKSALCLGVRHLEC